ncbi:MAG: intradiol ring-cleavage dioxygenase [Elainella sp.]
MKHRLSNRIRLSKSLRTFELTRREVLGFLGGAATVSLSGCLRNTVAISPQPISEAAQSSQQVAPAGSPACIVRPEQTAGPYFVDERLNRADVRSDPGSGAIKSGIPLRLVFQVSQIGSSACTPLSNATVDIWHCDAEGVYSDVNDRRFSTVGQKFLRGYQTTDTNGVAEFVAIYPGWYPGRTVHIHFKIRTADQTDTQSYEFTSQLYFDDAITDRVHAQAPYGPREQRQRNSQDGIFQGGGEQLMLQLTEAEVGYVGRFEIGLEIA